MRRKEGHRGGGHDAWQGRGGRAEGCGALQDPPCPISAGPAQEAEAVNLRAQACTCTLWWGMSVSKAELGRTYFIAFHALKNKD